MKLGFLIKIEREGEIFIREIGGEMGVLGMFVWWNWIMCRNSEARGRAPYQTSLPGILYGMLRSYYYFFLLKL
jgi:hypothetical protein